jgi:uncharacterized protein
MLIEETFSVDAPKAEVARFLLDVPRMGACVPGVEDLQRVDDDRYAATLLVRMGPIHARFKGDVTLDAGAAPDTIVATASGRDSTTGSVARVTFSADLVESEDGSTEIRSVSDVTIRGRLGQFGSGVVSSTAREMVKSFTQCAGQELTGVGPGTLHGGSPRGAASVIGSGVLSWLRDLWERIFRRGERDEGRGE